MKKAASLQKEDQIITKITLLMTERRQANQKIDDLQAEIDEMRSRIKAINGELESLIGVRTEYSHQERLQDFVACPDIPSTGIAQHMIQYLDAQDTPMSTEEIFDVVKAKLRNRKKPISIKSIGSYLSNLKCFENIKKKDIIEGKTHYQKSGWILNRETLKQN